MPTRPGWGHQLPAVQYQVSEPQLDLEGIFSGHARTGASDVSPNTCSCPSWLYVKDMSAEVDSGKIINYRISAKLTFKPE
jgi:Dodecin